jgi:hypothetical protein
MRNLDQPNKIIIRAIVQAAKELGIATLSVLNGACHHRVP